MAHVSLSLKQGLGQPRERRTPRRTPLSLGKCWATAQILNLNLMTHENIRYKHLTFKRFGGLKMKQQYSRNTQ